ncbi:MAG: DEAD/DEAH box helicase family protein, partial [Chloroflexota bacterium]
MPDPLEQLQELREELGALEKRRREIVAEIRKLQTHSKPEAVPSAEGLVTVQSSEPEKILLFRELFSGRDDVFPLRFESRKSGRSGYQPVCGNEWRPGICLKPKIKCAKCEYREFIPVTDSIVRQHLSGKDQHGKPFVMGIYPLRTDETCSFLAADFDKAEWQHDATAFLDTCDELGIPAYLERSRSGNGGHVWIFFKEPLPARLARKLGFHILTVAMENRPELGFDSYDRLFPNQDRMPSGGFGNLIALPLQKQARKSGNSMFVGRFFTPYADQWSFFSGVKRAETDLVSELVKTAEKHDLILGVRAASEEDDSSPWLLPPSRKTNEKISGPHPQLLKVVLANQIYIPRKDLSSSLRNSLLRLAAFANPEFHKAQAMRMPVYGKPRVIACAEEFSEHIALPRGCQNDLLELLDNLGIKIEVEDQRNHGKPIELPFTGQLRDEQLLAGKALLKHDIGILSAPTAFGKTVLAAWLIAQRKTNVLILVHRRQLMEQWQA